MSTTRPTPTQQRIDELVETVLLQSAVPPPAEAVAESSSQAGKRSRDDDDDKTLRRYKRARASISEEKRSELLAKLAPLERRLEALPILGTPEELLVTGQLEELCDVARLTEVLVPEVEAMYVVEEVIAFTACVHAGIRACCDPSLETWKASLAATKYAADVRAALVTLNQTRRRQGELSEFLRTFTPRRMQERKRAIGVRRQTRRMTAHAAEQAAQAAQAAAQSVQLGTSPPPEA